MDSTILKRLQDEAISLFPATILSNGVMETKCNFGLIYIANGMGCTDFDKLNATNIVKKAIDLSQNPKTGWNMGGFDKGSECALLGGLAFIGMVAPPGQSHGHVATISPKVMGKSPSWGILVPWLANIGKPPNAVKLTSACFRIADRPNLKCFWKYV